MKINSFILFFISVIILSCGYNKNETTTKNDPVIEPVLNETEIYNDILNDLIEYGFFNRFLGERRTDLYKKFYYRKEIDSTTFVNKIAAIKNELKQNPDKRASIFLKMHIDSTSLTKDDLKYSRRSERINRFLNNNNPEAVLDSLRYFNSRLKPSDFDLQLANIKKLEKQKHVDISKLSFKELAEFLKQDDNEIGYFAFSKLYLNDAKNTGLVYYFINCGPKCGKSAVLLIEKEKDSWNITHEEILTEM